MSAQSKGTVGVEFNVVAPVYQARLRFTGRDDIPVRWLVRAHELPHSSAVL